MSTVSMRRVELYVLKRDLDAALEALGRAACFQIEPPRHAEPEAAPEEGGTAAAPVRAPVPGPAPGAARRAAPSRWADSVQRLRDIRRILRLETPEAVPAGTRLPGPAEEALLASMAARAAVLEAELEANREKTLRTRQALEEAAAFAGLDMPFAELDRLSFLAVRIGRMDAQTVPEVLAAVGEHAIIVPVDHEGSKAAAGLFVAATTRKGRFSLDTELNRAGWKPLHFDRGFTGVPPELPAALEEELVRLEAEALGLEGRRAALEAEFAAPWSLLAASFAVAECIEEAKEGLESTAQVCRLEGWVPRDRVRELSDRLRDVTGGRLGFRSRGPGEVEAVRRGEESPPVLLHSPPWAASFERLVLSYGTPLYGAVDPTPWAAFFFTLLFAIMFGDLGQGLIILLAGICLRLELWKGLRHWRKFAPIVIGAGLGSMVMGFLTGSLFANEEWLSPLEHLATSFLLGRQEDRFLELMPRGGMGKILAFFAFTLGIGLVVNSLGLVFNIVNKLKTGRIGAALFSVTGLSGAVFFWWCAGMAVRVAFGGRLGWFDIPAVVIPLLLLVFEEPLAGLVDGQRHGADDGAFAFVVKGIVTLIESVSYYLSNSLSFLRVGAFALSHAVLSFITFAMGDMVRGSSPLGLLWEILVVILGNAVILVLEGMIVAIQVVRLQYYEFFSKFLTESGRLFVPFKFRFRKE